MKNDDKTVGPQDLTYDGASWPHEYDDLATVKECDHALCGSHCLCSCPAHIPTGGDGCPVHDPQYEEPTENATDDEDPGTDPRAIIQAHDVAEWLRTWAEDLSGIKNTRARMLEHAARTAAWAITDEFGF